MFALAVASTAQAGPSDDRGCTCREPKRSGLARTRVVPGEQSTDIDRMWANSARFFSPCDLNLKVHIMHNILKLHFVDVRAAILNNYTPSTLTLNP